MADKQKEFQEKYIEFQLATEQLKQLQSQMQLIDEQLMEIRYVVQSLEELKEVKQGTEILVPVANGIFAKAELKENDSLIVNVGSGAAVPKTVKEANEMLEKQFAELDKQRQSALGEMQRLSEQAQELEIQLNEMLAELQN